MTEHTASSWLQVAEETLDLWLSNYTLRSGRKLNMSEKEHMILISSAALLSIARSLVEAKKDA